MQANWVIVAVVAITAIVLIVYLIIQNLKDKEEVTAYFNRQDGHQNEDEPELNDEQ